METELDNIPENNNPKNNNPKTIEDIVNEEIKKPDVPNKTSKQIKNENIINKSFDPLTGKDVKLGNVIMSDSDKADIEKENLEVMKPDLIANAGLEGEYERSSKINFNKYPKILTDWQYYNFGFENKLHSFHKQKAPPVWARGYLQANQGFQQYNRSYRTSFNQDFQYPKQEDNKKPLVGGWMEMGWDSKKAKNDIKSEENYSLKPYNKTKNEKPEYNPNKSKGVSYDQLLENDIREQYRLDRAPRKRESVKQYVTEAYKDYISEEVQKVGSINNSSGRYKAGFQRFTFLEKAKKNDTESFQYNIKERDGVDDEAVYYNFRNKQQTKDIVDELIKKESMDNDIKPQKSNPQIGNKNLY